MDKEILDFLYNNFYKKGNYTQHRSLVDVFAKSSTVWNNQNSINELKSVINRMVDNKWIHINHSDFDTWGLITQDQTFNFRERPINALLLEEGAKKIRQERVDNSVILTNKLTWLNIGVTILFGIIVTVVQITTCGREKSQYNRELYKSNSDSLKESKQLRHDTIYENKVLRIMEAIRDSL